MRIMIIYTLLTYFWILMNVYQKQTEPVFSRQLIKNSLVLEP